VHQPLSKSINDDPKTQPLVLNASLESFKSAAGTDAALMEEVMAVRSGMPVDVTQQDAASVQSL